MARSNGSTATDAEGTDQTSGTDAEGGTTKAKPNRLYIVVPMTAEMKSLFESEATEAKVSVGPFVRNWIAQQRGLEIPVVTTARRSKYANDEERKAAQTARNATRSGTMKDLMAAYKKLLESGVGPEQAAQMAAAQKIASDSPSEAVEATA